MRHLYEYAKSRRVIHIGLIDVEYISLRRDGVSNENAVIRIV